MANKAGWSDVIIFTKKKITMSQLKLVPNMSLLCPRKNEIVNNILSPETFSFSTGQIICSCRIEIHRRERLSFTTQSFKERKTDTVCKCFLFTQDYSSCYKCTQLDSNQAKSIVSETPFPSQLYLVRILHPF